MFLIEIPDAVYFHVGSLRNDTKVRIDWFPPSTSAAVVITSYQVVYSIYEAVSNMRTSIKLDSSITSYVIQNLGKSVDHLIRSYS